MFKCFKNINWLLKMRKLYLSLPSGGQTNQLSNIKYTIELMSYLAAGEGERSQIGMRPVTQSTITLVWDDVEHVSIDGSDELLFRLKLNEAPPSG